MSLYFDGKVDPIAAAGGRELKFVPRHFHTISLSDVYFDTIMFSFILPTLKNDLLDLLS